MEFLAIAIVTKYLQPTGLAINHESPWPADPSIQTVVATTNKIAVQIIKEDRMTAL